MRGKRGNTRDNTPAVVHYDLVPGDTVDVRIAAKGGGSENKSKFTMLNPSDSIVDWVVKTVPTMGAGWCPPGMLGIGIGGSAEKAMLLAKEALMERIDIHELRARGPRNRVEDAVERSPLETLEQALHPWVAYGILPLFAFANAGLALGGIGPRELLAPLPLGIALGLVLGKPVGIVSAALAMRAAGLARFPRGMDLRAMVGLGMLCGIGFTMSLFIGSLAFPGDAPRYAGSVAGVLVASTLSALAGLAWLRAVLPRRAVDVD